MNKLIAWSNAATLINLLLLAGIVFIFTFEPGPGVEIGYCVLVVASGSFSFGLRLAEFLIEVERRSES